MQAQDNPATYNRFLLLVAGLGGLLYGVDVGIIGGALPYLEATSGLNAGQLSVIVAAVLSGQCDLYALCRDDLRLGGAKAVDGTERCCVRGEHSRDRAFARLWIAVFGAPVARDQRRSDWRSCAALFGGVLIGRTRGKGTGIFQWLLTLGIFAAALIGIYFSYRVARCVGKCGCGYDFRVQG